MCRRYVNCVATRWGAQSALYFMSASLLASSALAAPIVNDVGNEMPSATEYAENLRVTAHRDIFDTSPDLAERLDGALGYSRYSSGGVSSLPVLNGMADDRVATSVDGMRIGNGCPNHMNPAMSYVDPDSVTIADAIAGITPVAEGGDSIGGSVIVRRRLPQFSKTSSILVTGRTRGDYRSNGGGSGASGSLTVANDVFSLRYTGSYAHASNYRSGGDGHQIRSSSYLSFNHAVTLGYKKGHHTADVTVGQQDIPYEGFPNAYMDMTNNRSTYVNAHDLARFDWGTIDARVFWQRVNHVMNMLSDKGGHSATSGMPMNTDQRTAAYTLGLTLPLTAQHKLQVGSQFYHDGLNDWWPPLQGSMMMGPGTFHNINHGHRNRLGHYVSWDAQWTSRLSTQLGLRNDIVMMNTGDVAPYSWTGMMSQPDAAAAGRFNARDRGRTDVNFDVTATLKWRISGTAAFEGGYARKTRSPNIYERYAWGMGAMATKMVGWFGDGNGYVGNPDIKPEIAHTVSWTLFLHDQSQTRWSVAIQPFYTYTQNYINVERIGSLGNGFQKLQFVNHNAQTYGINANGRLRLWDLPTLGRGAIVTQVNWVRGQDEVTHSALYHQMPTNGTIGFHTSFKNVATRLDVTMVKRKSSVDWLRNEPRTPGYALVGLGAQYRWHALTFDGAIENMLDQKYFLPLGGWSLGDYKATGALSPLAGMGRSFNLSVTATF